MPNQSHILVDIAFALKGHQDRLCKFWDETALLQSNVDKILKGKRVSFKRGKGTGSVVWYGNIICIHLKDSTVGISVSKREYFEVPLANIIKIED